MGYRSELRCTHGSKVAYRSAAKARQAARKHRHADVPLFVYQCRNCGGWHITSEPQKDGRS